MKKHTSYTSLLGITQLELAMLLKVSRPLITLFELGKKDLPVHTKPLLAEMLVHMQSPETAAKSTSHYAKQDHQTREHFKKLLDDNAFKRLLIVSKINTLERKLESQLRRAHLNDFLNSRSLDDKIGLLAVRVKIEMPSKVSGAAILSELKLKQQLLEYENSLLTAKLEKLIAI